MPHAAHENDTHARTHSRARTHTHSRYTNIHVDTPRRTKHARMVSCCRVQVLLSRRRRAGAPSVGVRRTEALRLDTDGQQGARELAWFLVANVCTRCMYVCTCLCVYVGTRMQFAEHVSKLVWCEQGRVNSVVMTWTWPVTIVAKYTCNVCA